MSKAPESKKRTDWDAVERDYRAGNFTLRELATRYGCSHQAVAKKSKVCGWSQDLSKAVKAATNARLIQLSVAKSVAASGQAVANTVLAAAELNAQVVFAHRQSIARLRKRIADADAKLSALGDSVADIREAKTYMDGVVASIAAEKTLVDMERKALGIDDAPVKEDPARDLSDEELTAKIEAINARGR